jgi:hypothetical protein
MIQENATPPYSSRIISSFANELMAMTVVLFGRISILVHASIGIYCYTA